MLLPVPILRVSRMHLLTRQFQVFEQVREAQAEGKV